MDQKVFGPNFFFEKTTTIITRTTTTTLMGFDTIEINFIGLTLAFFFAALAPCSGSDLVVLKIYIGLIFLYYSEAKGRVQKRKKKFLCEGVPPVAENDYFFVSIFFWF